jgi:hypothetical protein
MRIRKLLHCAFNRRTILLWLALVTILLTVILPTVPGVVESAYSRGIYPLIASLLSAISSQTPFSIDDLFYLMTFLAWFSFSVFVIIRKKSFLKWFTVTMNLLSGIYLSFYWLWGFNYFRQDMNTRLSIRHQKAGSKEFATVFNRLISATNDSYTDYRSFDKKSIDFQVEASYRNFADFLSVKYPGGTRHAKNITLSGFFSKASISGYFGPFFNEIHLNRNILPVEYPMVLAHEKAHQFGITSEAEANFFAWMVCSHSDSKQLRYSGNLYLLSHFMYFGKKYPETRESIKLIDKKVSNDFKTIENHWAKFRSRKIEEAAGKVNDVYLKTNRVKAGIGDYSGVIRYVLDFSLDANARSRAGLGK